MNPKPRLFYGWVIVVLSFMSIATYGLFNSYGVFIADLEAELHASRTLISGVYTTYMLTYGLCAVPMGLLSDRYGPRKVLGLAAFLIGTGVALSGLASSVWQMYLFFGFLASLGHGAVYVVPISTLNRWFVQKRGLAVGVAICGLGFGLLVVPPLAVRMIDAYGWRVALIILGISFFIINGIAAIFIRGKPADKGTRALGENSQEAPGRNRSGLPRDFPVREAITTRAFGMLYLISIFSLGAEQMALVHVVPYGATLGISAGAASLGLSFLGAGSIIGRLLAGAVSDRFGRLRTLAMFCGLLAASLFLLMTVQSPITLYASMLLMGLGYAGVPLSCSVMLPEFFGLKHAGILLGLWFTSGVPAGLLGPLMGGIVFDLTKGYFLALLVAGLVCVVATVLVGVVKSPQTHP